MSNSISELVQNYFDELESALKLSSTQTRDLVDEIRSNAIDKIADLCRAGVAEAEAVSQTLDDLGSPSQLAESIRHESPPFHSPLATTLRGVGAVAAVGIALYCGLAFRASFYGPSWTFYLGLVGVFLPLVLLLWPKVIWRVNWLFSFIPVAVVFAAIMLAASLGTNYSENLTTQPALASNKTTDLSTTNTWIQLSILLCLAMLTGYLLLMVQQVHQRKIICGLTLVAVAIIETPFLIEECMVRNLANQVSAFQKRNGTLPTPQEFSRLPPPSLLSLNSVDYRPSTSTSAFTLSMDRQLFPSHRIIYSGPVGDIVVTD